MLSTVMVIARIVAPRSSSAARVGPAFSVGAGSCAPTAQDAASSAPNAPRRSVEDMNRIARQRNGGSAKLVCTATQLRRLGTDQLHQRHRAPVGIDGKPLVFMFDMQRLSRAPHFSGREAKFSARRSGDGLVGLQVLLAD